MSTKANYTHKSRRHIEEYTTFTATQANQTVQTNKPSNNDANVNYVTNAVFLVSG